MPKISVKRIDNQNNDLTVVNAARVSFDKIKNKITNRDIRLIRYLAEHNHFTPFTHVRFGAMTVMSSQQDFQNMVEFMGCPERSADMIFRKEDDSKYYIEHSLYGWLKNKIPIKNYYRIVRAISEKCPHSCLTLMHKSELPLIQGIEPEELVETDSKTVLIEAPIFILRQLMKSTVGCTYNEVSRRYVDSQPNFYLIDRFKARPDDSIKQGAGKYLPTEKQEKYIRLHLKNTEESLSIYNRFLKDVAPEEARANLTQNMMSKVWLTASKRAFDRILLLRSSPDAQTQIRELAIALKIALQE